MRLDTTSEHSEILEQNKSLYRRLDDQESEREIMSIKLEEVKA